MQPSRRIDSAGGLLDASALRPLKDVERLDVRELRQGRRFDLGLNGQVRIQQARVEVCHQALQLVSVQRPGFRHWVLLLPAMPCVNSRPRAARFAQESRTPADAPSRVATALYLHSGLYAYTVIAIEGLSHAINFPPALPPQTRPVASLAAPHLALALSTSTCTSP